MKKFIVALGVAAVALGFSSCNNNGSNSAGSSNDSLSILLGQVQGSTYHGYWEQMPDTMKAKLNKDAFIAGFKSVIDLDPVKDQDRLLGMNTAMSIMQNLQMLQEAGVNFNKSAFIDNFAKAFKQDSIDQNELMKLNEQLRIYMNEANEKIMQKQQADQQRAIEDAEAKAKPNKEAGKAYVEEQKKKDASIKTLESGVSYKVIQEGKGNKPGKSDNVKVNYVGRHIDGKEFDSSKGEPRSFNVAGVVPGFSEILQMMAPGAKYVAYIPSEKGYGNQGAGDIQPGETLVFEIEMVEVTPNPSAQPKK